MAHNYGLLLTNNGLLWGIVAYCFQLLGCPGSIPHDSTQTTVRVELWAAPPKYKTLSPRAQHEGHRAVNFGHFGGPGTRLSYLAPPPPVLEDALPSEVAAAALPRPSRCFAAGGCERELRTSRRLPHPPPRSRFSTLNRIQKYPQIWSIN